MFRFQLAPSHTKLIFLRSRGRPRVLWEPSQEPSGGQVGAKSAPQRPEGFQIAVLLLWCKFFVALRSNFNVLWIMFLAPCHVLAALSDAVARKQ